MASVADILTTLDYGPAPESAGPVEEWLERHGRSFGLFIGGKWTKPKTEESFETLTPANGKVIARVAQASDKDVDAAVKAARKALPDWQGLAPHARARYLYAIARGLQRRARFFAVLETMDNGKPIRETRDIDVPLVARHFYHHAGWCQLLDSELPGYAPVGVVGQVIPWNFPLLMLAWKIAPALACGNTVVLKPAEFTPLTALAFAELCADVGLPPCVVNIITGDGRTGAALVNHPDVDKVAFTGSTDVGRIIREATAGSGKKLSLELGGKSPFVVFEDADLDSAVEGVVDAIWFNQGQVCCAGSRLLLQEGIADAMVRKLQARMETLRVGDPLDKAVDIGAIVAPVQLQKIQELVAKGKEEGATCWQPSWACPTEGWFYPPTLFTDVSPSSTIAQVEIFGPVLVAMTFRTPVEAVELANNTRFGLAASVWSESLNLALDIAPKIKAGVVWVNCTNLFDAAAGFGGYRESGFGREGGREGLFEYLKPAYEKKLPSYEDIDFTLPEPEEGAETGGRLPRIDRTPKMYVGGAQVRPDAPYVLPVVGEGGRLVGEVGRGNRKDIRNAVEAARKAEGWTHATGHNRAQVLFYIAENLAARDAELVDRLDEWSGGGRKAARREVEASLARLFHWAAWADKYDGAVHHTPFRNVTLAMPEPLGVMGVVCPPEAPLLAFVSLVGAAIAMGNRVVAVPSQRCPLAAVDLYQVFDTSDLPGGAVNIVTGIADELAEVLALHDGVDALWYVGSAAGSAAVERTSIGNLKQTWVNYGKRRDWYDAEQAAGRELLRRGTQVKNIWVPYGE
ncbi:MAG TPA: aldehyde dehydrogenase family protein [Thermoanaerobaculia bacterium]|nr:aldehyde dehydrogenase family protein [Thermoanaerobaculia bacterium]